MCIYIYSVNGQRDHTNTRGAFDSSMKVSVVCVQRMSSMKTKHRINFSFICVYYILLHTLQYCLLYSLDN